MVDLVIDKFAVPNSMIHQNDRHRSKQLTRWLFVIENGLFGITCWVLVAKLYHGVMVASACRRRTVILNLTQQTRLLNFKFVFYFKRLVLENILIALGLRDICLPRQLLIDHEIWHFNLEVVRRHGSQPNLGFFILNPTTRRFARMARIIWN